MNKGDSVKYSQELYDMLGKPIVPGCIVIINNNYESSPIVGVVDHFTVSGKVAVRWDYIWNGKNVKSMAYRRPKTIVILKDSNK